MAEEKLGTLEYDMKINDELLNKTIAEIDKKLKEQDEKWKKALSNIGEGYVSDTEKMVSANKKIASSTDEIKGKIATLRADLKKNVKEYENMKDASSYEGKAKLQLIQQQKYELDQLNKLYRSQINTVKELEKEAQRLAKAAEANAEKINRIASQKKFVAPNTVEEIDLNTQLLKQQLQTKGLSQAGIDNLNSQIAQNTQKRKELIATLKQQAQQERQNAIESKLLMQINSMQAGSLGRLKLEIELYRARLKAISPDAQGAKEKIQQLTQAIDANQRKIADLQPQLGIWGKLKSAILTYVTAYLSVQGAIASGRAIYNQTKALDQLNFSMKTVIKSATELAQTQKFLGEVAINYGGDLLTISERYIKFRAAAMQSNMTADDTQKIFNSVSKAAGTLGLKTDELTGVYLALEQMISKGKVTTEELRRQLGERLPGAFGIMANALGVTIPQLDKMLKKGEVLSKDALPKFAIALEKAYGIEAVTKIDTLAAAQGRLSTQVTLLIKSMEASGTFKSLINGLASAVGFVREYIGAFVFLGKTLLTIGAIIATNRAIIAGHTLAMSAANAIQKLSIILWGQQTKAIVGADFATRRAALGIRQAALETGRWNTILKTFGGGWKLIIDAIVIAISYFVLFRKSTDDAANSVKSFDQNLLEQQQKLNTLFDTLNIAQKGHQLYKDTLFQINTLYGKYLPNLLTEKSSLDEVTQARKLANKELENEMNLIAQREEISKATEQKNTATMELYRQITSTGLGTLQQRGQLASDLRSAASEQDIEVAKREVANVIAKFLSAAKVDSKTLAGYNAMSEAVKIVKKAAEDMIKVNQDFENAKKNILNKFPAREDNKVVFDIADIETYKKSYDEASKLISQGRADLIEATYFKPEEGKKGKTFVDWLKEQIASIDPKKIKNSEEALRALYIALADATKKEVTATTRENKTAVEALKERLDLLKQMKASYDDLTKTLSPEKASAEVAKLFAIPQKNLGVKFTPTLDIESFNAELLKLAEMAKKIDQKLYESILEIIATASSKNVVEGVTKTLDQIDAEIEKFKQENALKEAIFNITGIDRGIVVDDIQFLKDRILDMAKATGDIKFGGSFDELVANLDKITPTLKAKIEALQKYIADKSSSTLLDALKFVYQKLPEGTDLQFDFSNILVELEKVLKQADIDIKNFTSENVLKDLNKYGIGREQIDRVVEAQKNTAIEKAKDDITKLASAYIKSNLTTQMRNDFKNMSDASIESIRNISKALDDMMENLRSDNQLEKLFKVAGVNAQEFQGILAGIKGTSSIDEFKTQVDELGKSIEKAEVTSEGVNIGGNIVSEESVTKLKLFQKLIKALFGELDSAKKEVKLKGLEKLASNLKLLETEIGNLIDSAGALSEAFGTKMTESAQASLEAIKKTATGIVNIISGVAKLASTSISMVEKASVILAIISTVMQVITSITNVFNQIQEDRAAKMKMELDLAEAYNDALRNRNILLEQSKIIFGDDKYKESISFIYDMSKAQNLLADAIHKVEQSFTTLSKPKPGFNWNLNFFKPVDREFYKLTEKWNDLLVNGELNIERAKAILAEGTSIITEESKKALEQAIKAQEDYKKAWESFDNYLQGIFGEMGGGLMDAITANLSTTKNALDDFTTYASSSLEKLFKDLAYTMYLAPIFRDLQKRVEDIYIANKGNEVATGVGVTKLFEDVTPMVNGAIKDTEIMLKQLQEAAKAAGFDVFSTTQKTEGLTQAIQGVTEDTARRLEGLINSIRETQVVGLGNSKKLVESSQLIQGYAAESLGVLRNIDVTVSKQLTAFLDVTTVAPNKGGRGLKVVVD